MAEICSRKLSSGFGAVCCVPASLPLKQFCSSLVFVARRPRIVLIIYEKSNRCLQIAYLTERAISRKKTDCVRKIIFSRLWKCFTTWKAILSLPIPPMGLNEKGGPCITPHSSASHMHQAGKHEQPALASCPSQREPFHSS